MHVLVSLVAVLALFSIAYVGAAAGLQVVFGIMVPYLAIILFLSGIIYRVSKWAMVPVPFRIPTTCGQQLSLPWIKQNKIDNPTSNVGVIIRMALEVLTFRSLFRNTRTELRDGPVLSYASSKWLWVAALVFHYTFLVILIRHMRFFTEPIPAFITFIQEADGFFQVGVPVYYATTLLFIAAVTYLFLRRILIPQMRYISLTNDYFPLFLLIGIGTSGFFLRHLAKTDIVGVKELAIGLISFAPMIPEKVSPLFYGHLFLVSVLFAYFPVSKLTHMLGVFLSPTRNMANNSRMIRHINPWNYPVKTHPYEEYEEDFREKLIQAGIPLDNPDSTEAASEAKE